MDKVRKIGALSAVIFSLFFSSLAKAQGDGDGTGYFVEQSKLFYAGIVGGANFAQVDGDDFAGYYKFGLNVGGIGYLHLAKFVSLSWEILYSQKGSKSDVTRVSGIDSIYITKYGITANYAEIPVMINIFDRFKSHIGVGLSYNRLVSSSELLQTSVANPPVNLYKYPFNKDELEILAGANLHLVKGLFLNLRFQYSITPMRTDVPPNFSRATQYNNLWTLRLMYLFM
jgi:Outer membrane protein beta-barrel domain